MNPHTGTPPRRTRRIGGSAKGPIPEIPWNDSTSHIGSFVDNVPTTVQGQTNISRRRRRRQRLSRRRCRSRQRQCHPMQRHRICQARLAIVFRNLHLPRAPRYLALLRHRFSRFRLGTLRLEPRPGFKHNGLRPGLSEQLRLPHHRRHFRFGSGLCRCARASRAAARQRALGQADYTLYPLSKQHAAAFHDVTAGNNSVVCDLNNPDVLDCESNGFVDGWDAAAGFDDASGLGSLDVTQLVQNWSKY